MYSLTNTGPNRRIIYDARRRLVAIEPGQTRENVNLDDGAADYIARRNGTLKVERMEIPAAVPVQTAAAVVPAEDDATVPAARTPAQLLVAAKDDMPYAALRREAARTLGDLWPGGKPSREVIMEMLQNAKMGF